MHRFLLFTLGKMRKVYTTAAYSQEYLKLWNPHRVHKVKFFKNLKIFLTHMKWADRMNSLKKRLQIILLCYNLILIRFNIWRVTNIVSNQIKLKIRTKNHDYLCVLIKKQKIYQPFPRHIVREFDSNMKYRVFMSFL